MRLLTELSRRNVLRMAVLYAVTAWLIMQVAEVLMGLAALPDWMGRAVLAVLAIGFPIALIFAWLYEITPEGLKLESEVDRSRSITHVTGRRMDFIAIAILAAAVILFAYDKWWVGPPPEKSIAVLAFENMSGDSEQEYFSDGISEEILNLVAQIPELTVISRSSSFSFKGKDTPIPEIAEQLNVAHVLEGSVRRVGDRVRITAQLIDADADSHLWSQSYDRNLDDIFAVQDEIAAAISDALRVKLAVVAGESVLPAAIKPANSDAYDAYLQGRGLINNRNRESMEAAIQHLERSLRLDEGFAPAHAQLAIATILLTSYVVSDQQEARRQAIRHLDRAQELEPGLAEAHGGRALLAHYAHDWESTIEHARKALAANPNHIDAMAWLANALIFLRRGDEAKAVQERMLATDPLSIRSLRYQIGKAENSGRIEEAHALADQLAAQNPSVGFDAHARLSWAEGKLAEALSWALRSSLNHVYAMETFMLVREYGEARRIGGQWDYWIDIAEGRWDEVIQKSRKMVQLYPNSERLAYAAEGLYNASRFDEALPLYERALDLAAAGEPIPAWSRHYTIQLAVVRRKMGDEEGAQAAVEIVKRFQAERDTTGPRSVVMVSMVEAYIAAFEHETDRAIGALESGIRDGLRWWPILDDPVFQGLWDEPRFVALRKELDAIIAEEHEKVLQLICFNNPVPDDWQPMPETCEGVVERRGL